MRSEYGKSIKGNQSSSGRRLQAGVVLFTILLIPVFYSSSLISGMGPVAVPTPLPPTAEPGSTLTSVPGPVTTTPGYTPEPVSPPAVVTPEPGLTPTPLPSLMPTPSPTPSPLPPSPPTLKTVGYITHWQAHMLQYIKLEQLTHLIWQSVQVSSATDPTLKVSDNYPGRLSEFTAAAHAKGIKILACLGEPWGSSKLNEIWKSPQLRGQLIANLKNLVVTNDLDGIDIDHESNPDPGLFSTFLAELYGELNPLGKVISMAGSPYTVSILPVASIYLDFINIMTYDMAKGAGYPYHSTLEESAKAIDLWANAGIPKNKLLMGIPFYGRDFSTTFYHYYWIVDAYNPPPGMNQVSEPRVAGRLIWWNGVDLVKKKVDYIKSSGLGGAMVYEVSIDVFDSRSLLLAIYDEMRVPYQAVSPETGRID